MDIRDNLRSPWRFSRTWTAEDKDKDLWFKDKDKYLKIGPRGQGLSSRTTTLHHPTDLDVQLYRAADAVEGNKAVSSAGMSLFQRLLIVYQCGIY